MLRDGPPCFNHNQSVSPESCGRLESGWKIRYNGASRWVAREFVVIRSWRAPMSDPDPAPERADLEERIYQGLRQACDGDLRRMAKLLASKPYKQLLGQAEFEVRDLAHDLGARALQTALDERKKGATRGPA